MAACQPHSLVVTSKNIACVELMLIYCCLIQLAHVSRFQLGVKLAGQWIQRVLNVIPIVHAEVRTVPSICTSIQGGLPWLPQLNCAW